MKQGPERPVRQLSGMDVADLTYGNNLVNPLVSINNPISAIEAVIEGLEIEKPR